MNGNARWKSKSAEGTAVACFLIAQCAFGNRRLTIFQETSEWFSLSSGERGGVRASVKTILEARNPNTRRKILGDFRRSQLRRIATRQGLRQHDLNIVFNVMITLKIPMASR